MSGSRAPKRKSPTSEISILVTRDSPNPKGIGLEEENGSYGADNHTRP